MKKLIFDPLEEFRDQFKSAHQENVVNFFNTLVKQSGVDLALNDLTIKEINTLNDKISKEEKRLKRARGWRGFFIFLIVALFVLSAVFIYQATLNGTALTPALAIVLAVLSLGIAITLIIVNIKVYKPRIKNAEKELNMLTNKRDAKIDEAWSQMNPLNALFDSSMTPMLVEKTIPLLTMDPVFDSRRFDYLNRKYGLSDELDVDSSALFVQSGEIQGNPFLLSRALNTYMGTKTYTGSITVSYTVTVYVNNKAQTQVRTETLTASITKPCPYYYNDTVIIYGNEAAPNLSFSRYPQLPLDWTPKSLNAFVKKEEKEMKKMTEQALKRGHQFTPMGNSEFEALFNAYNRTNELEFRLLFTALGQSEITDLIKDKTVGFGDDFEFHKTKNLNLIRSRHSQAFDYSGDPRNYYHYNNKEIAKRFIKYNNDFMRYFYFNLAPILAVPLYQQHKPQEFIYAQDYKSHLSFYEHEAVANQFPSDALSHPESKTKNILKTKVLNKGKDFDVVGVTSYGYKTINRTTMVPKRAGNGSIHHVPVHWVEYIPVEQESVINVKVLNEEAENKVTHGGIIGQIEEYLSKYSKNSPVTSRRVLAFIMHETFKADDNEYLDKIIKGK